jgi:hypothetical protein
VIAVPTEESRGSDRGREQFARAVEAIGEDPARFLDRDLFGHGVGRLKDRDEADFEQGDQRIVRDGEVSEPGEMIRDRIHGIDRLSVAASWMEVERELERTPDDGRDVVIQMLRDRIDELEANGERDLPGRSDEELRELGVEAFEAVAPKDDVVYRGPDGEPTGRGEGFTASQKLAAMADGGEGE